jgi:hypothetical protein
MRKVCSNLDIFVENAKGGEVAAYSKAQGGE